MQAIPSPTAAWFQCAWKFLGIGFEYGTWKTRIFYFIKKMNYLGIPCFLSLYIVEMYVDFQVS